MKWTLLAMGGLIVGLPCSVLRAQCTTPNSATTNVRTCGISVPWGSYTPPKLGSMTLSTGTATLTTPDYTAYDANLKAEPSTSVTATVTTNGLWDICVTASTTSGPPSKWTAANDATYAPSVVANANKLSTDLKMGMTYSATGAGYVSVPSVGSTGAAVTPWQNPTASSAVSLYLATVWTYEYDTPGQYSLLTNWQFYMKDAGASPPVCP